MRAPLLLFLVWLTSISPAFGAITQSEAKELQALAKAYGLPAVLTDAASTYLDTGDVGPLRRLLLHNEPAIAMGAAGFLLEAGEEFAPDVVAKLKRGEGAAEAQIACLAFATDRATVQYLVERRADEQDAKLQQTITTSLRVITGMDLTSADEWSTWWRKQSWRYRPKSRSMEEIMSKVLLAQQATLRDSLKAVAEKGRGRSEKGAAALENVAALLDNISEMQEEGRKLRLSRFARQGDDCFRRGDFVAAEAAYGRAAARQPKDHRSAFLQACALVELGKSAEAQAIFSRLHREDARRQAAAFMAEVCAKEIAAPGRMVDHAIELRTALGRPEDVMAWGDPTLRMIVGQRLSLVSGPEHLSLEELSERFATEQDPQMLLGLALCHPPAVQGQLLKGLAERFPANPAILSQHLRRSISWRTTERRQADLAVIRAWVAAEPDNALPRLLEIAAELEPSTLPPDQASQVPVSILMRLEEAMRLPRYEKHVGAAARAQLAALRSTESRSLARVNVSGSQHGMTHLWACLSNAANGMQIRQEHDALDRISDILAAIANREAAAVQSSMDRAITHVYRKHSRSAQLKDLRACRADDPRLPKWEAEDEKARAAAAGPFSAGAEIWLEILPVPSLQLALTRRTYSISGE
jgi:hypothetical protein